MVISSQGREVKVAIRTRILSHCEQNFEEKLKKKCIGNNFAINIILV